MILIIQNGQVDSHIGKYLNEDYKIVKSFESEIREINLDNYSKVIILGGYQSVVYIEEYPELLYVLKIIKNCLKKKIPILGICLGSQLLAYALGCKISKLPKIKLGFDTAILNHQNIFRCHHDYIEPCDNINVLETKEDIIYLFRYQNCVGIQCHPDIPPEHVYDYKNCNLFQSLSSDKINQINKSNRDILNYIFDLIKN